MRIYICIHIRIYDIPMRHAHIYCVFYIHYTSLHDIYVGRGEGEGKRKKEKEKGREK